MSETPPVGAAVMSQLRSIHALKAGALAMFDPMLQNVASERDAKATPANVAELLRRMHDVFSGHREETATHVDRLARRIDELGGKPASPRAKGFGLGAKTWVSVSGIGGQNHGANARNAFVFEHLEIATLRILGELADRAGDEATAALARDCVEQDEEMAATIGRNWTNVTTLMTAR